MLERGNYAGDIEGRRKASSTCPRPIRLLGKEDLWVVLQGSDELSAEAGFQEEVDVGLVLSVC